MTDIKKSYRPYWIWIIAFILLQLSSEYSIFFLYTPGTADVYLTFSIGVILIYWLGPKVLLLAYLNALVDCYFWGHENLYSWPLFAIPETLFFFLSWWLFVRLGKGKFWLPDLGNLVKFLLLGISLPLTVYMIFLKQMLAFFGELDKNEIWSSILASWLGDFMPTIMVTLPILFYVSKPFFKWMKWKNEYMEQILHFRSKYILFEVLAVFALVVLLSLFLDFNKYWYLFGLISLIVSVRHGFGATTLVNLFTLVVIYFVPASIYRQTTNLYFNQSELLEIYLGINMLSLFSIVCGRVISDYRQAQNNLHVQMEKVEHMNTELDRFVYSVSHDLVAPLKSIKGLTNLMKKDINKKYDKEYILRIEESAEKLDEFIGEILDYSRSTRKEISLTNIDLEQFIQENISNHKYVQGFDHLNFDLSELNVKTIMADKMRLKIILNNLISNAIKFSEKQKEATIIFTSEKQNNRISISVKDNGPGISSEYLPNIFDMFFRGMHQNSGSGLGLFIAREAAENMDGNLIVESRESEGSKFILTIPG